MRYWKFNSIGCLSDVMLVLGLVFMPGIWWAKVMLFIGIKFALMSIQKE